MRIHYICRGNAYRSRLAEAYTKSIRPDSDVISSGTVADSHLTQNEPIVRLTLQFLKDQGLGAYAKQTTDQLTQERILPDDIAVCLNQRIYDESAPFVLPKRTEVWDITDWSEAMQAPITDDIWFVYTSKLYAQITQHVDELLLRQHL
jgi:protein-tyrosine-phosphatase